MKLSRPDGTILEIKIKGYQFPDITDDIHDANWLQIQFISTTDGQTWETTKPCMLTWEVEKLIKWLDKISLGKSVDDKCYFIEPVISFQYYDDEIEGKKLRIDFSSREFDEYADRDEWLDFPFENINFERAIESLQSQLENYPKRAVEE